MLLLKLTIQRGAPPASLGTGPLRSAVSVLRGAKGGTQSARPRGRETALYPRRPSPAGTEDSSPVRAVGALHAPRVSAGYATKDLVPSCRRPERSGAPQARKSLAQGGSPGLAWFRIASPGGRDTLSHSYSQNHVHLVFSTKNRQKFIPKKLQRRLWSYTAAICRNHDILVFAFGGMDDHIHILFRLPPTLSLSRVVALIKSNSSTWIKEQGIRFSWQQGYGASSVSSSNISAVIKYIDNQEAHHRKMTFEQEFIALLKKHGVEFDPRYVFD